MAPKVFLSSTCYDLRQVREDIETAVTGLGLCPLRSEAESFPIDPTLTTVENCQKVVRESADILVLVIGGRYGSVDSGSGKSITNLEYLAAKTKGIPVYAFVDQQVLT